jgi:SAM-dependent methyltransferase
MSLGTAISTERTLDRPTQNACPACGGIAISGGVEIPDHEYDLNHVARYSECRGCGTLFQLPMPTVSELRDFYPPEYHSLTHAGLLSKVRNTLRIRRLAKLATADGAILDYGCGDGEFLKQAADATPGRKFWGFEIAARHETIVAKGGAVTLIKGDLPDLMRVLPNCSLITLNHVIEHLPDPLTTVTALTSKLSAGGVFEGQTPAANSLERDIFGARWSGYHAPRHTVIFSSNGLRRFLERCGLSDPIVRAAFNPAGLAVSLASIPHRSGGRIQRRGTKWLAQLAMGAALSPIDLFSGRPGIVNFVARKTTS